MVKEIQKTLIERGVEAWCDSEHDVEDARGLDNFNNLYYRVKGVNGQYHVFGGGERRAVSPGAVTKLCEYQHPDIILTYNGEPFFSIEITNATPYSGANPVQRLPRAVRAAELGVPSAELAPWISNPTYATARGVEARLKMMQIYEVPCLSILFKFNNRESYVNGFNLLKRRVNESLRTIEKLGIKAANKLIPLDNEIIGRMRDFCDIAKKTQGKTGIRFRQVEIEDDYIKVNVDLTGKRRYKNTKTGWETKGTGLLDPYPGYILAYDFILCRTGPKITDRKRKIYVHFRDLPRNFEFFERARKSGGYIYWNLLEKFSDGVIFKGETIADIKR